MIFGLNLNELVVGAIYGGLTGFYAGWLVIAVVPLVSILWALGGRYGHSIRVFGVPLVSFGAIFIAHHHWTCFLSYALTAGILSLGYGIPSKNPPDKGSLLGEFWYDTFQGNEKLANIFARGTIYILLLIAFMPSLF